MRSAVHFAVVIAVLALGAFAPAFSTGAPAQEPAKGEQVTTPPQAGEETASRQATPATTTEYHIEVGDGLDVTVWQAPELSRSVTVRPDGKISYPLAQELTVAGLTVPEAEEKFVEALSRYVRAPAVSIVVTRFAGEKVMILGEVTKPDVYRFTGRTTVVEALGMAGGYTESASFEDVTVTDRTGKGIRVDLNKLLIQGDWRENIVLHGGDVIFIRKALRIFVLGEVRSPGAYSVGRAGELDMFDLIMRAGGPTDKAQMGNVRVIRKIHEEKPQTFKVDLRRAMKGTGGAPKFTVKAGDVIYVPRSTMSKVSNLITKIDDALSLVATGQGIIYSVDYHRWAKHGEERAEASEQRAQVGEERAEVYFDRDRERFGRERQLFEWQKESQEFLRQRMEWERDRFEAWEEEQ